MKVKKYRAASMPEVMKKVREELGAQAVILQSKTAYTGGVFGMFKKKYIEVTAGIDETGQTFRPEPLASLAKSSKDGQGKNVSNYKPFASTLSRAANESIAKKTETADKSNTFLQALPQQTDTQAPLPNIAEELSELKKMVRNLNHSPESKKVYPPIIQQQLDQLKQKGIRPDLLEALADHLLIKWETEHSHIKNEKVKQWVVAFFMSRLPIKKTNQTSPSFVYMLGPTGVGKTTTIAKLASRQVLDKGETVAFVTTDTYRIAAVEQLKTYATLLNAPIEVAYSPADMISVLEKLKHYDTVYIDTAGRSFLSNHYIEEISSFIQITEKEAVACYLVLSAAAKEEDNKEVIRNFASVPLRGLIFTKLDETQTKGSIINLSEEFKIPVAYTTDGQNVPEDLNTRVKI